MAEMIPDMPPEMPAEAPMEGMINQPADQSMALQMDDEKAGEMAMKMVAPMEGMINQPADQSMALQMDDEKAGEMAMKMVASSKNEMYGESFDSFMQVLQRSDNLVEDLAMISLNVLSPEMEAASTQGGIPFDYIMDVSAEVVSEAYDMAVQTGTYQPSNELEIERNQNITLTMVAGELGKMFFRGIRHGCPDRNLSAVKRVRN